MKTVNTVTKPSFANPHEQRVMTVFYVLGEFPLFCGVNTGNTYCARNRHNRHNRHQLPQLAENTGVKQ